MRRLTTFSRCLAGFVTALSLVAAWGGGSGLAAAAPRTATPVTATLPRPPAAWTLPASPALPAATVLARPDRSVLLVPLTCQALRRCPLVTLHHPRDQSPARLLDSAGVRVYLAALLGADYAVLLSEDAGPTSWGSPAAVQAVLTSVQAVTPGFAWNGRWYAFGISMGGVTALNLALDAPATLRPHGLLLLDARLNLPEAQKDPSRRAEILAAYGTLPPDTATPLDRLRSVPLPPTLAYSSPDDQTVPEATNTLRLVAEQAPGVVQHQSLSGSHLGGRHFAPELATRMLRFLNTLEGR